MTKLSVNINKIALLRNARGRDYPHVGQFAARCLELGAHGITLHPRPDERHARYRDIADLAAVCRRHGAELNVEGYPSAEFLDAVVDVVPDQCTLVPDSPDQLTSDHGWDLAASPVLLTTAIERLRASGIRVSLFVDFDNPHLETARTLGADRIELYTEPYVAQWAPGSGGPLLGGFRQAAQRARAAGLGVNAGHDLNLDNLADFLTIPGILEVSIGHALIVECIESGVEQVIRSYLSILAGAAG
jgi:pyridoxine 5-phosphate synthase